MTKTVHNLRLTERECYHILNMIHSSHSRAMRLANEKYEVDHGFKELYTSLANEFNALENKIRKQMGRG